MMDIPSSKRVMFLSMPHVCGNGGGWDSPTREWSRG